MPSMPIPSAGHTPTKVQVGTGLFAHDEEPRGGASVCGCGAGRGCPDAYNGPMAADIRVTVRLFASLRDAAGTDRLQLVLPPATPVGAVWGHLPERVRAAGLPDGVRYAVNHDWTLPGAPMRDGDEVALVLPVSGG
jgi:molybdopterin converting factor small subunit